MLQVEPLLEALGEAVLQFFSGRIEQQMLNIWKSISRLSSSAMRFSNCPGSEST